MNIHKSICNSALASFLAVSSVGLAPASYADDDSNTTASNAGGKSDASPDASSGASEEPGAKSLHAPTEAGKSAPCVSWLPADGVQPRVAMLCIHGFSLHKGCYAAFGKEMAKGGIATYAIDMRGFGELKSKEEHTELDFEGCLADIKLVLEQIHKNHPGLPVIILGESMGGAIALRATAHYPQLVSGLISSVPARDRFAMNEGERNVVLKSGLQTIFGGYRKPMTNVASAAVEKISEKEEVRSEWKTDPLMRNNFSPKEFVQLDQFLARGLNVAPLVKNTPVLFIQGTNDKLIRPAGTWKLFERLATSNRQLVLSKNSEHLIFEEGQFRPDDLQFVLTWIDRNIAPLDEKITASKDKLPVVASKEEYAGTEDATANNSGTENGTSEKATAAAIAALPPPQAATEFKNRIATTSRPKVSYWIELNRDGKIFRCNNKMEFKSGDSIRFHLIPESDGYAYLVMKASTTGKSDVLFPTKTYGEHNYLKKGQDYPIPAIGWMQFDKNPGTEQLGLVFGQDKVDVTAEKLRNGTLTCFVSPAEDGSKDLCPTRMKLSWDDPMPVMIPEDFSPVSQIANAAESSLVRLMSMTGGMVSASIQLLHGK